jgi:protein-S-isoprenylcysteine O-methyltransferase Ste14
MSQREEKDDMKSALALVIAALLLMSISLFSPAFAQSTQVSYTVNTTTQTYQAVAVVFVIIAVALAAFTIYQMRSREKTQKTVDTKAVNTHYDG